ncbi:MAG: M24 family metallopeptidase [Turneriella sp.]
MSKEFYTDTDLANFRECQKLAYQAVTAVAAKLKAGDTERYAAELIDQELKSYGISRYFHAPFAWFGARTAFQGIDRPFDTRAFPSKLLPPHFGQKFMPTETQLTEGMCVILDVAPIFNDCAADIGYSYAFGRNERVEKALDDLAVFRPLILGGVCKEKTMAEIYEDVSVALADLGYENCHAKYPQGVLGHKVGKIPTRFLPRIPVMRFEVSTFLYLAAEEVSRLINPWDNHTALWAEDSRVSADPGLWAVEPHVGVAHGGAAVGGGTEAGTPTEEFGVKWEEIIHITENNAYYLDEALPHVERWAQRQAAV